MIKKEIGFTLIELLVVVVLLGIIASIASTGVFNSSGRDNAKAQLIMGSANAVTNTWKQIVSDSGTSRDPFNDVFFQHASHTALDVVTSGDIAVSATFDGWYNKFGPSRLSSIIVSTAPTATAPGAYMIDSDIGFSISSYSDATRTITYQFTNVTSKTVMALVEKYDDTSAFNAGVADTSGVVQYTSAASGKHTVTILLTI